MAEAICSVDDCTAPTRARGWCMRHYKRWHAHGDVHHERQKGPQACIVDDCERPRDRAGGYCSTHGARVAKHGDPNVITPQRRGADHPRWRGGRHVTRDGYVKVTDPETGARLFEHQLVMKQVLGRDLVPGENVHHKNGVRDDNRPENLELWVTSQPAGQRPEDLVAWAKEVLRRYG